MKKYSYIVAAVFGLVCCVSLPGKAAAATSSTTAIAKCQKRVALINKRGNDMGQKSQALQARYKKTNVGWKTKMLNNRTLALRNKKDPRLQERADFLMLQIDSFETNVKLYNSTKSDYINERNAQVKSYKNFSADCNQVAGRSAAQTKVKQLSQTDSKKLSSQAKELNKVYTELVRPDIVRMADNRAQLLNIKKSIKNPKTASASEVEAGLAKYKSKDLGEKVDNSFDSKDFPIIPPPPPTR